MVKALEMYEKALMIHKKLGQKEGMASDYCNMGIAYKNRGELDRAEELLTKSLQLFREIGNEISIDHVQGLLKTLRDEQK